VALKAIVDEALDKLECVEKAVVFSRSGAELCAPREIDFNKLLKLSPLILAGSSAIPTSCMRHSARV
jgi:hypothetical protein